MTPNSTSKFKFSTNLWFNSELIFLPLFQIIEFYEISILLLSLLYFIS